MDKGAEYLYYLALKAEKTRIENERQLTMRLAARILKKEPQLNEAANGKGT